jgi:hypothetical protein
MKLIETKTLGTAAASIEFTSIPQTFTDLVVLMSCRTNRALIIDGLVLNLNGSAVSFTGRKLQGDGSSPGTETTTTEVGHAPGNTATANTFSNVYLYIPNYTGSTNKSLSSDAVSENNATAAYQTLYAVLWSNTAAITSLRIAPLVGTELSIGSTISLYGITKGSDGIVTTS